MSENIRRQLGVGFRVFDVTWKGEKWDSVAHTVLVNVPINRVTGAYQNFDALREGVNRCLDLMERLHGVQARFEIYTEYRDPGKELENGGDRPAAKA